MLPMDRDEIEWLSGKCIECGRSFQFPRPVAGVHPQTCSAACRRARRNAEARRKYKHVQQGKPVAPLPLFEHAQHSGRDL